ncbi:MAG: hypothetical protein ACOYL3_22125 [Desulfuromonadaceae bacterium]
MPIPLILLGAAALAGGFGVKKGVDAKSLFRRLKTENLQAQKRHDSASKELEQAVNTARITFEVLGNQKIELYKNSLIPFVEAFSLIKNVDFKDGRIFAEASLTVTQADMLALLDVSLTMKDVITTGVGCLGGGGLTALAAYGVNGLLGTVSAGSAFGSATGAAATNSVMASIGGGGMAAGACVGGGMMTGAGCMAGAAGGMAGVAGGMAGGMGMAGGAGAMAGAGGMGMGGGAGAMAGTAGGMGMCGGTGALAGAGGTAGGVGGGVVSSVAGGVAGGTVGAVTGGVTTGTVAGMAALGGMIAGPFMAVGGMVLASKAKKATTDAGTNIGRVNSSVEQLKNKQLATEAAFYRVYSILSVLGRLDERFTPLLTEVQQLVVVSHDYSSYADKDKKVVMMAAMLAKTIKNVMETSILDDNGMITSASEQIVAESERVMQAIAL